MAIDFFLGAASGSQIKALRQMEERKIMVNWTTENNGLVGTERKHFVDSGGSPETFKNGICSETGDYPFGYREYLQYIESLANRVQTLYWSTWDYPCEQKVLDQHGRTVKDHQKLTITRAKDLLERAQRRGTPGTPVPVIQGQEPEEYIECIDMMRDAGVLRDYMGIGSVCRRGKWEEVRDVIAAVREELPPRVNLHGYGIKKKAFEYEEIRDALASADSTAYSSKTRFTNKDHPFELWKQEMTQALDFKEDILRKLGQEEEQFTNQENHKQVTLKVDAS
jgi:hypothetical protein